MSFFVQVIKIMVFAIIAGIARWLFDGTAMEGLIVLFLIVILYELQCRRD